MFGFGKKERVSGSMINCSSGRSERIVADMEFFQSGTFRGYKRYKLTTYQEPGVAEGIASFRSADSMRHYEIKRGTPVRLIVKEVCGVLPYPYRVMEVYAGSFKVGVLYGSHSQYPVLFSEPFDKVFVLIEGADGRGPAFDDVEVYLFAHYPAGAPVSVRYSIG